MLAIARAEAVIKQTVHSGGVGERHGYIGESGTVDNGPQAFLVVRPFAGARIEPHFHDVDQFQVIVAGDGRIGKKPIRPVTFQYADAFTPYGPIIGNDEGFAFFTLRNIASGGFWAMPGNRQHMPGRAGRNIEGVFELTDTLPAPGQVERLVLMPEQADDVTAVGIRLGPGAVTEGIPMTGRGQFYLVCEGTIEIAAKRLDRHSVIRLEPHDEALALRAGDSGAQLLALQFAPPSDRPGTDPRLAATRSNYVRVSSETAP